MSASPAPSVRRRARAGLVAPAAPATILSLVPSADGAVPLSHNSGPATVEMRTKLGEYVRANGEKNAANRRAEAAKRELHRMMGQGGVEGFEEVVDGKTYAATIASGESVTVDVARLRALVDDATFMAIISATQSAVLAHVGTNLLAKCTVTAPKEKSLSIGEKK